MFELNIETGRGARTILDCQESITIDGLWKILENKGLRRDLFYIRQNGRLLTDGEARIDGRAAIVPRLLGGKGGFGSMLRAIGAQIEKTTNREACRDLSGRRLRDINEEKRLKAWIEKQESREEEEVERKKRKLQKLCAVPKHEFKDKRYEEERSNLTHKVADSVEEGFKMAAATAVACEMEKKTEQETKSIKRKTILDDEFDSDELESSDSENEEANPRKKLATGCKDSSDSGCSSEESRKACAGSDQAIDENSGSSGCDRVSDSRDSSDASNEIAIERKATLDEKFNFDESESEHDDENDETNPGKKLATHRCKDSLDSGCLSEEFREACSGSDRVIDVNSESSGGDRYFFFHKHLSQASRENYTGRRVQFRKF